VDTRRERMTPVEATQGAVVRHLSDGATTTIAKVPLEDVYPSVWP
jgi:hypothetical protein